MAHVLGTVMARWGSHSHVTVPSVVWLMSLYANVSPTASITVYVQSWSVLVYCAVESVGVGEGSKLLSSAIEPAIRMVWLWVVTTDS